MKLKDLLNKLNIKINESVDINILNVTSDSRKCHENTLYFNINKEYLTDAINHNVKVIVSENYIDHLDVLVIYVKDVKKFYYKALKAFYNINNGYKIGVTGTCGKTTTVTLLYESLKLNDNDLLLISSNGNYTYTNKVENI